VLTDYGEQARWTILASWPRCVNGGRGERTSFRRNGAAEI
jgi:hypothetical protein